MRFPTRFSLGLLATALGAPLATSATAQQVGGYSPPAAITLDHAGASDYVAPAAGGAYAAARAAAVAPRHDHKGLFGWRHCAECQRARARAESGVDVPPPPSYVPQVGAASQGRGLNHVHAPGGQMVRSSGCAACDADAAAVGGVIVGPVTVSETDVLPAGHAVTGGVATASNLPAGHAVVGPDPAPVGVSRASQGNFTPFNALAAGGPRPPLSDPSVTPTSMIPPAQTAVGAHESKHPRVISHLFGLPDLRRLRRETSAYKRREGHASISYEENTGPVTEIPASMVYGKSGR